MPIANAKLMFSHGRFRRRAALKLLRKHTAVLILFILCAIVFLWYVRESSTDDHETEDSNDDGELGVDYEWVATYTDAKGIEREVPVVQRRDGVILLTTFNFYSVVNFDVYRRAYILWITENSGLCDDAERALSAAVRQLVSPIDGERHPHESDKRGVLYSQFLVDVNDDDHLRLVKSRGLNSNDFPTFSVVYEARLEEKIKQLTIGYTGPVTADGLQNFDPMISSTQLLRNVTASDVVFEGGILRV